MARIGRISSHNGGTFGVAPVPCSGIERQALAHCFRAFCSKVGSLRIRASTAASWSETALSRNGLTWWGTLMRAPATETLVSPRLTWAARFGSTRHAAANLGREVTVTLPRISALALRFLILIAPICLAALPPSRLPIASPSAPVAFADSEPVTFSVPVNGVAIVSTSWPPVAEIGPRDAVQPMSAFCSSCEAGFSALPLKLRGVLRSAELRIADSEIATGAITTELREAGGNGGTSTRAGGLTAARGASQSIAFRLTTNDAAITATAMTIVLGCIGRRIVPPNG